MSSSAAVGADGVVNKVQVKRQIKSIVKDLENILGDLKDVAKELKEVVHNIDCLTSDLHLEEMMDGSRTDTLNSSSSSTTTTTTSSTEKIKVYPEEMLFRPSPVSSAILTVLKTPDPPLPPPRLTPSKGQDHSPFSGTPTVANGSLMWNSTFSTKPTIASSRPSCCSPKSAGLVSAPPVRHAKSRCPQTSRERVRFSEKVQYHGYCPDCDMQDDVHNTDLHFHTEVSQCSCSPEAEGLVENSSLSFTLFHTAAQKPHKTILRKSTSTTV